MIQSLETGIIKSICLKEVPEKFGCFIDQKRRNDHLNGFGFILSESKGSINKIQHLIINRVHTKSMNFIYFYFFWNAFDYFPQLWLGRNFQPKLDMNIRINQFNQNRKLSLNVIKETDIRTDTIRRLKIGSLLRWGAFWPLKSGQKCSQQNSTRGLRIFQNSSFYFILNFIPSC